MEKITRGNVDYNRIYHLSKQDVIDMDIRQNGIRLRSDADVKEIVNAIKAGATFISCIEVNINSKDELEVADGQHRLWAYQELWKDSQYANKTIDVRFLSIPENKYVDIVRDKNIHSKNWTISDYMTAARKSNPEATKLDDFCIKHKELLCGKQRKNKTYPTKIRYAMAFIKGANVSNDIKRNTLTISKEELDRADELYEQVTKMLDKLKFLSFSSWFESFIQAWYDLSDTKSFDAKIKLLGGMDVYYKYIHTMERSPTASKVEWKERFTTVLNNALEKELHK